MKRGGNFGVAIADRGQERNERTPVIVSTDPLVSADYAQEGYVIDRSGQGGLKITVTVGQGRFEELFDGTRCTLTIEPHRPNFLVDADFAHGGLVLAHSNVLVTPRDSPLRDLLSKPRQDRLLRQATAWKYLGEGFMDNGLALDRISICDSADRTWELWIGAINRSA